VDAPASGAVKVAVRPVDGLDQLQLSARGLEPATRYTLYARREGTRAPLVDFTTDQKGAAPQVLVFVRFSGVYEQAHRRARIPGGFRG
jgi:hypothetical protein